MKIVNQDIMFNLRTVSLNSDTASITLDLDRINGIPRKFKKEEFKKFKLKMVGCKKIEKVYKALINFKDNYIDIEQLESGNLDIWCESTQIIEVELNEFSESVENYSIDDWIIEYESLTKIFYRKCESKSKYEIKAENFETRLLNFLEQDLRKIEIKSQLVEASKLEKRKDLVKRILNMIENHKIEKEKT